jgi:hypothetical protein
MHGEEAENLFRDYLERQGWPYWTESDFRRELGLSKADPAPDFTILNTSGTPKALVEVSQFNVHIDFTIEEELIPIKTSPLYFKFHKKSNQLRRIWQNLKGQHGDLPIMLVLYDPQGAQTHFMVIMQRILGLTFSMEVNPLQGKIGSRDLILTPRGRFLGSATQHSHLSAVAALHEQEVSAKLSGFDQEIKKIKSTDYKEFLGEFEKIYNEYRQKGIDVSETIPVLQIFQNPKAEVEWGHDLWGRFDQVWGLADRQTYGLIYNGLLLAHAGIIKGVGLPDPTHSSRSSGFYDE